AVLRVQRREAVLVDQHGLVRKPCRPAGLADTGEHTLAQFAGPGHEIQALGFLVLVLAVHRARHVDGSSWSCLGCASSSVLMGAGMPSATRSEEHTSELQSRENLVCRLLLEKKKPN